MDSNENRARRDPDAASDTELAGSGSDPGLSADELIPPAGDDTPGSAVALYDNARRALSTVVRIDEVKNIHDKALALKEYARRAKDRKLIAYATTLRRQAELRAGELMAEMRFAGRMSKGVRGQIKGSKAGPDAHDERGKTVSGGVIVAPPEIEAQALAALGVDKSFAKRARKAYKEKTETPAKRAAADKRAVEIALATIDGDAGVLKAARKDRHAEREAARKQHEAELGQKIAALPVAKFGVILADPEWRFQTYSPKGLTHGSADNHYPTSELEDIKARDVASIAADECVLFLWVTVPMLMKGGEVMAAWGFEYVTNFSWKKDRLGQGYWNRNQHEHLLVDVKGKVVPPAQGEMLWSSIIDAPTREHSVKPDEVYELIESYFPTIPKIELNARRAREGWAAWGNEAPAGDP
jgi:N6-adenosine-specific RNA methylase IME4